MGLCLLGGALLHNSDLIVCGGYTVAWKEKYMEVGFKGEIRRISSHGMRIREENKYDEYLRLRIGMESWHSIGRMMKPRSAHSSVFINNSLFSCGGEDAVKLNSSHHEEFRIDGSVKEKKELPIKLLAFIIVFGI